MNENESADSQSGDESGREPDWISGDDLLAELRRYTWLATLPLVLLLILAGVLFLASQDSAEPSPDEAPDQGAPTEPAGERADDFSSSGVLGLRSHT